jgi:hypothetical protein
MVVPLLLFIIPAKVAVPVTVLLSISDAIIMLAQDWRQIHSRSSGYLLVPMLAGISVDLLFLPSVSENIVKITLDIVIIPFPNII